MTKLLKRIAAVAMAAAMAATMAVSTNAATYSASGTWSTHYYRYDSHISDDVYVTYCGDGFKAKITSRSGGTSNAVKISSVKSDGNTSLHIPRLDSTAEVSIPGNYVEPTVGSTHFIVTLLYVTSGDNDVITNNGEIRMATS